MDNYIFINSGVVAVIVIAIFVLAVALVLLVAGFLYKDEKFNEERKRRRVAEAERDAYLNFFTERDLERYKKRFFKNLAESEITDSRKGSGSDG